MSPSRPVRRPVSLSILAVAATIGAALGACQAAPLHVDSPPAAAASTGPATTAAPSAPAPPVHVQILAMNDFHGNLVPPVGSNSLVVTPLGDALAGQAGARRYEDAGVATIPAGGAAYLATYVRRLRAENPRTVVVSAGDLTGASPLVSNLFKDEPTVLVMNRVGLDFEGVGNHDFDRGIDALLALQKSAKFTYLAANVTRDDTKQTVFPPYAVRDLGGVKVAFVGVTLKGTPAVTVASAVKGLTFADEAATVNALVPDLQAQGVAAIVLLLHQGGQQAPGGTYDGCDRFSGDVLAILEKLSPAVQVVVSAHTHQAYDCIVGDRLVTSAGSYGRLVTKIDLTIDPATHTLVAKQAKNVPITRDVPPDPEVAQVIAKYEGEAATITGRVVGWVGRDFTSNAKVARSRSCETPLGDLIADSQRESTGADIAFMNPGGIRGDLVASAPGKVEHSITYAEAFEVQPFGGHLVTMTLTGAQIRAILERQFGQRTEPRILQVSKGFTYRYDYDRATQRAKVDAMKLHGVPIDPRKGYRVTVNSFLAGGGDAFAMLMDGTDRKDGAGDLDAFTAALGKRSTQAAPLVPPPTLNRIDGNGCE